MVEACIEDLVEHADGTDSNGGVENLTIDDEVWRTFWYIFMTLMMVEMGKEDLVEHVSDSGDGGAEDLVQRVDDGDNGGGEEDLVEHVGDDDGNGVV